MKKKTPMLNIGKYICYSITLTFLLGNLLTCKQATPIEDTSEISVEQIEKDSLDLRIEQLMIKHNIPSLSLALLKKGKLATTKTYGILQKGSDEVINENTMFSVGSISKVVNAILTLRLVEEGKLDLDTDINQYLTKWKVEESKFTQENPVTLRKILSHTAGFTVHGFDDYLPEEELPTTLDILNGNSPAKNDKVYVHFPVGSKFKYSGGGTTVIQHLIEEITDLPYHKAAKELLFDPLELKRTSYENPLPASLGNIAKAHDGQGNAVALPRGYQSMPEAAASGLWITPSELARLLSTLLDAYYEKGEPLFSRLLIEDMMTPEPHSQFGLGPEIELTNGETFFYHDGANDSYRAHFKVSLNRQVGYIIFTNGTNGIPLIKELKPLLDERVLSRNYSISQ